MELSSIQAALPIVLPIIAALVSYLLQANHFGSLINASIALASIVAVAVLQAFIGGRLTGSVPGDIGVVLGLSVALQSETFRPLQQYLRDIHLPFMPTPPPPTLQSRAMPATTSATLPTNEPRPIIIPAKDASVTTKDTSG